MPMQPVIVSAVSADLGVPRRLGRSPEEGNKRNVLRAVKLNNRLTALLVDGVPFCRMIEKGFLRSFGVETQDLDNGRVALNLLASDRQADTCICFYDMETLDVLDDGVDLVIQKPLSQPKLVSILMELDGQI